MESAVLNHSLAAMGRNGQRCIHFMAIALVAMSEAVFGA
jgi:hypothetical protein